MKHIQKHIAVLDLGSTKIVCFIARLGPDHGIEIIGIGHQVSQGIRAGVITDIRAAESAILAAIDAAEKMAGVSVEEVVISITGSKVTSHTLTVEESVRGHEITTRDIDRMVAEGYSRFESDQYEVLHCIPTGYTLDDESGIKDPRGMYGHQLKTQLHVVTTTATSLLNITNCLAHCHLNINECVVAAYASGLACLAEDERQLGATLIDIGGGHTSIAIFRHGHLVHIETIPLGGMHITSDIAWGLSTNLIAAERIKTLYGNAMPTPSDAQEMIDVIQVGQEGEDNEYQVSRAALGNILRPRLEEILELVKKRLAANGYDPMASGRVVLTGGTSQLVGLKELASQVLGKQVRIAIPKPLKGLAESTKGPAFSTSIGLLQFVADKADDLLYTGKGNVAARTYFKRVAGWLKSNF